MRDVVNSKSEIIPIDVTPGTTRVDKRTLKMHNIIDCGQ